MCLFSRLLLAPQARILPQGASRGLWDPCVQLSLITDNQGEEGGKEGRKDIKLPKCPKPSLTHEALCGADKHQKNPGKELEKAPKPQVSPTRCPLPSLLSPPVISSPLHPPSSSSPFPPGTLLSSARSCILVFGVFLSCRKFLMLSIMQPALASPALPGSPPKDSHVPDSQRRRHRSPPKNGIYFSLFAFSFSFVVFFSFNYFQL